MSNYPLLMFSDLLKKIRKESKLTQTTFAKKLGVSKILIAMIESEAREPSKKFIEILAKALEVHPFVLMPFLNRKEINNFENLSSIEKKFLKIGIQLQKKLIEKKSKLLQN